MRDRETNIVARPREVQADLRSTVASNFLDFEEGLLLDIRVGDYVLPENTDIDDGRVFKQTIVDQRLESREVFVEFTDRKPRPHRAALSTFVHARQRHRQTGVGIALPSDVIVVFEIDRAAGKWRNLEKLNDAVSG